MGRASNRQQLNKKQLTTHTHTHTHTARPQKERHSCRTSKKLYAKVRLSRRSACLLSGRRVLMLQTVLTWNSSWNGQLIEVPDTYRVNNLLAPREHENVSRHGRAELGTWLPSCLALRRRHWPAIGLAKFTLNVRNWTSCAVWPGFSD